MNSAVIQVLVRHQGDKWMVKIRELERIFADEREAMSCAVQMAQESGKNGTPSVVLLHGEDATLKEIWTSGKDAPPLQGERISIL
jgi:hypothetical protein